MGRRGRHTSPFFFFSMRKGDERIVVVFFPDKSGQIPAPIFYFSFWVLKVIPVTSLLLGFR